MSVCINSLVYFFYPVKRVCISFGESMSESRCNHSELHNGRKTHLLVSSFCLKSSPQGGTCNYLLDQSSPY